MKKWIFLVLAVVLLVNGCSDFTPEKILKNPDKTIDKCGKLENSEERNLCLTNYAKSVSLISKDTSVLLCSNIDPGYPKNKCLFDVFSHLERKGMLLEGLEVCKLIEKEGYPEWCDSKQEGQSISVAPALQ